MDIINLATEFVKKIMGYVPEKIKNFKEENKIYLEIDAALQELFKKFNVEYHYLEDICEDDLIDNVITDYLKTSSMDMSKTIEGYLSHYTWCKEKKAVVKKFLNDFCLEILAVQKEHLSLENKILVKCIDKVEEDIKNHISLVLGSNITINKIDGVFGNLVHEGRLNQLRKEIEIFDALGQATKQIVSFYKVIAAFFYDKSKLITEADNYFEVTDGSYDDRLFKFFIANNERNLLLKYQHKVSSALKFYVETFINENFWGNIIFHNKQDAQNALEITDAFIYEGLFSYFYMSDTPIYCFQLFEDINNPSAIQKIQLLCLKLLFFDYGNIVVTSDRKKEMEKLVSELKKYSSVIDEFDIEYKKKYYSCFLMYEGVNGRFENSYKKLPNEIKNCHEIIELNYIHQIRQGVEVSLLEIYNFCVACKSDKLLHIYLNVAKEDGKDIIALLSNNTIILHFSLAAFYLYCNELYVKGKYLQCRETLKEITEFSDTIEYLCLKGQLEFVDGNKEFSETVDILKSKIKTEPLTHSAIFAFIEFSVITKSYKIIYEYDWENTTIEIKLFLIDKIIGDKNAAHNDFLVKICSIVINEGYEMPSIYYYRGVANYNLNRYIDATSDLEVSFNLQNYLPAAIALLKAKFLVNDFSYTPAINYCIDVCDQEAQYLVGCYYERLGKEDIAYNCYLRSLLLSPVNNPSIGRLFGLAISDKNINHPTTVTKGTVCELKSYAGHILNVCIHDRNLKIENMEISDFAGCKHFFEDDEAITELLFCKVNDIVRFNEEEYTLIGIKESMAYFANFAMSQAISSGGAKVISGTIDEMQRQIQEIAKDSAESTKQFNNFYYENQWAIPLSFFARSTAKTILETLENLMSPWADGKILNNEYSPEELPQKIVLSYDAIVSLYLLKVDMSSFNDRIILPKLVGLQLQTEIMFLKGEVKNVNEKGVLTSINDKFVFVKQTDEQRRTRLKFLNGLEKFVKNLPISDKSYELEENSEVKAALTRFNCYSDFDTIGLAKHLNAQILSDNPFVCGYATARHNVNTFGLVGLFNLIDMDSNKLSAHLSSLAQVNFANYLPEVILLNFTKKIEGKKNTNDKTNESQLFCELLLHDYKDDSLNKFNREQVVNLYRKIIKNKVILNECDKCLLMYLEKIAIDFFKKDNPEVIQKIIHDCISGFKVEFVSPINNSNGTDDLSDSEEDA